MFDCIVRLFSARPEETAINLRRVVTGHANGKAIVVSDGQSPKTLVSRALPGVASSLLWQTPLIPTVPNRNGEAISTASLLVPEAGATKLLVVVFAPDAMMADPDVDLAGAFQENMEFAPDFVRLFEPDNPGMHTTDTVDYVFVLEGEIWLELDDGKQTHLKTGDIVVQNGTRHAWRNKSDRPARLAFVLIGANRQS